jgi:hypothetical protein
MRFSWPWRVSLAVTATSLFAAAAALEWVRLFWIS